MDFGWRGDMKFGLVITYDEKEAQLFGKVESGALKIVLDHPEVMDVHDPRGSVMAHVKGLYIKFLRDMDWNVPVEDKDEE
jgi:hypothetical protein